MKGHRMDEDLYIAKLRIDEAALWKNKRPLLTRLDIELTERCNNNCIHCCINLPARDQVARERECSTEEVKENLREAAALGCLRVRFTGGEPLLRKDFEDLYLFARKLGLRVILFTNATLITPHLAELLARVPPLEKIEITVYGMDKSSYGAVTRATGSYESFRRGMNLLLEKRVPFVVKGVVLPPTRGELDEFVEWTATIPLMDKPPAFSMFFYLRCRRDSEEKNRLIRKLRLSPEEGLGILNKNQEKYLKSMQEFCLKFAGPPGDRIFSCGAGIGGGCIDAYGYFQPCMMLKHPDTAYDLRNGSIKDAITDFFPEVRQMRAKNTDYLSRCARCFLKGFCDQCPSRSWVEHGTLDTPVEYLCKITHFTARYFGLLKDSEMTWEVDNWEERVKDFSQKEPADLVRI